MNALMSEWNAIVERSGLVSPEDAERARERLVNGPDALSLWQEVRRRLAALYPDGARDGATIARMYEEVRAELASAAAEGDTWNAAVSARMAEREGGAS